MSNQLDLATEAKKKVFVETWGCQMNVADSESMLGMLEARNYEATNLLEEADLVLLNTCHIREKATHKVLSRLGAIRHLAEHKPGMKVAVAGCVAQAEGLKLLDKASNIDILLGPGQIEELPKLIARHDAEAKPVSALGFKKDPHRGHEHTQADGETPLPLVKPTVSGKAEITRYVNIAQGCDNFCTFCVVPHTRGREISRTANDILIEAKAMLSDGAREITLLGQNVNSYGQDLIRDHKLVESERGPFVDLLEAVVKLPGLERLRFTTSNPHDFSKPIAELFRNYPKLGRYIHLPVQSGSDTVLERMKRKVTVAEYWERVRWLRDVDQEMALSTDLIVGFPGETDEQFAETLQLVEQVRYSFLFAFKYSARKGTAAARFRDQVPEAVQSQRLAALQALQDRITLEQNLGEIGKTREVLCHYESRKEPGVYYSRTEHFRLVKITSKEDLVGKLCKVEITDANKISLLGRLV